MSDTLRTFTSSPEFVGALLSALITAIVTGGGLYFAWLEIRRAREEYENDLQWKRSEYVRGLLAEMITDEKIALICRILDWREGPALIPADFVPFFNKEKNLKNDSDAGIFEIDWSRFVRSLTKSRDIHWRNADLLMYRTCFDSFCSFIQRTADDFVSHEITTTQFADLSFYCHRIINPRNQFFENDAQARKKFKDFILFFYNESTYEKIRSYAENYNEYAKDDDNMLKTKDDNPLELFWEKSSATAREAAAFAGQIIGLHAPYISHGEIQTGLSDDGKTWAPDLAARYEADFLDLGEDRDLLTARLADGTLAGIAIVAWEETPRRKFAVLEDMAVDPDQRSLGIGAALLEAVDVRVKARGVEWLFLESGKENLRAHAFFERHGFEELSHVFAKRLGKG
jgi:ribosomal protein S18 acetylase RimI-like enzyme